nr:sugar ABC transporter permease [Bacilli bacterium]
MENTLNNNPGGLQAVDWDAKLASLGISVRKELRTKRRSFIMPEWAKGWIALIPALIFLILFMIYPILNTFVMSFVNNFYWVGNSGSSFVITNYIAALNNARGGITVSWGIENYIKVLSDPVFQHALINTGLIVIVSVPLTIIISLLLAVCLNAIKPLKGLYQTIFFLPYVTNTIALGLVFNAMFSSSAGSFFNVFLGWFGAKPQEWLTINAGRWNMFVVIVIYAIWNGLAFKILVFMSGLSAIDKQYYDAARIDGSSKFTIFRKITVPLLS